MDISSLLSPQDSPAVSPSPPAPRKLPLAHTAPPNTKSPLSQSHTPSPITPTAEAPPTFRRPALPAQRSRSHTSNPTAAAAGPTHSPLGRHASTSGMDTLADLAAMQHAQPATAGGLPNPTSTAATSPPPHPAGGGPPHPTAVRPSLQEISRAHSGSQSSVNISLGEVPTQTPQPRTFTSATLSAEELAVVSELAEHLAAHPHAYAAHAQLVETLFDGLVRHAAGGGDPRAYDLLPDLRQAVDAMASRYALGEELWLTRLAMQRLLATNLDDGSALVEMLEKAVDEEAGSAKIWAFYGDFVAALHDAARDDAPDDAPLAERPLPSRFSDEDRLVGVEVFGREQVLAVFKRAADATKWHLSESHKLWDRYTALILQDLGTSPGPDAVAALKAHYVERLQTPHAQWENTFQQFSTLISTHDNSNYEAEMVSVKKQTADAREKYAAREMYEVKLAAAAQSDRASEWAVATQYLEWELANRKKKTFSHPLLTALFQRVLHRFPAAADTWTELLLFLGEDAEPPPPSARPTSTSSSRPPSLLPTLDRATAHCPWSGALWALYIQTAEREDLPFPDIGQVKHKATSTGLLDHGDGAAGGDGAGGGVAEALAVHAAWAGYLRRRAFRPGATDEERDVAEVGLRSALEDATTLGARQQPGPEQQSAHAANGHGAAANGVVYRGDPEYRLERTYIKFLDQSRHVGAARDTWRGLVGRHGDGYAFWLRFYEWEMRTWARLEGAAAAAATTASDASGAAGTSFPRDATNVLQQAARRLQLDWPEKILETYQRHCEDHEDVATLQAATRLVRRRAKEVARRREKEAVMAAEEAATAMQASRPQPVQQQQQEVEAEGAGEAMEDVTMTEGGAKRKRDDATNGDAGQAAKRSRASREEGGRKSEDRKTQAEPVRDREHTMVIVRNLPWDANEKRVRHLFHDVSFDASATASPLTYRVY